MSDTAKWCGRMARGGVYWDHSLGEATSIGMIEIERRAKRDGAWVAALELLLTWMGEP